MINENLINEIRQKADIVEIISSYMPITQKGKNFFGVCPFHDDHKPSMSVSKDKQIFNCFTCHTGGNVFTFIMKYEDVSFSEAVKIVANKIGININISNTKKDNVINKKDYDLMDLVKKFYLNNINTTDGKEAKKYLNDRGITNEIIKEFSIGLATREKNNLYSYLSNNKYDVSNLENLGLITKNGLTINDFFINRIVIPIHDIDGNAVGFTGRIFHNEDLPKYLNTKETVIFKKGDILFNFHLAKNYAKQEKKIIIVEGNMDAIKMYSSGIKNVIALMGTALTEKQVAYLKKLRCEVILMLDNDDAGYNATLKNADILYKYNINPLIVRLSGAKDPDEYINKFGVSSLKEVIKYPLKYLDFKIDFFKKNKNLQNSEDLADFIKNVMNLLSNTDDLTKNIILTKISKEYNIDYNILNHNNISSVKKEEVVKPKQKINKHQILANYILYYLMNSKEYLRIYKNDLGYFENYEDQLLEDKIEKFYNSSPNVSMADFISYISEYEILSSKTMSIIAQCKDEELDFDKFNDYIKMIKKVINENDIKILKNDIKNENDINRKIKLMEKLTKLKKGSVENE